MPAHWQEVSASGFSWLRRPAGQFLGIPFDVRHITISAGNTALGLYGLDNHVPAMYLLTVVLGVLMIGFLNFFVSFSLAFFVAVKSRGIRLRDYRSFSRCSFAIFSGTPAILSGRRRKKKYEFENVTPSGLGNY